MERVCRVEAPLPHVDNAIRPRLRAQHQMKIIERIVMPPRARLQFLTSGYTLIDARILRHLPWRSRVMQNPFVGPPALALHFHAHEIPSRSRVKLGIFIQIRLP